MPFFSPKTKVTIVPSFTTFSCMQILGGLRLLALLSLISLSAVAQTASRVASYTFENTLSGAGGPDLIAIDPASRASFVRDTVFGAERTVYQFGGTPTSQGGLALNTTNLVNVNSYSIEMIFTLTERAGNFRRVLDVLERTSDRGLYVNAQNRFEFSRLRSGTATFNNGTYYHLVLTVSNNVARLYLNGSLDIDLGTDSMNITTARRLVHFFVDNTTDTSTQDYSSGRIALLRAYTNPLTQAEVTELARNPFGASVGVGSPTFTAAGVRNGATFSESNPLAPGAFFSIFGGSLTNATGDWSAAFQNGEAPRRLNGTRILIGEREAFLSFTSPGQINAIAPDGIGSGPVSMVVERDGVRSAPITVQARALNPAFFTYDQRNRRYIAALNADNTAYIAPADLFGITTLNGLAIRPARPGEFVIAYGMGMGPTTPALPAGRIPPPRDGGYPIAGRVELSLGNRTVTPLYVGLSSFAGVYLVGFQVPDLVNGDYELTIRIDSISSPTGVVIPVAR